MENLGVIKNKEKVVDSKFINDAFIAVVNILTQPYITDKDILQKFNEFSDVIVNPEEEAVELLRQN